MSSQATGPETLVGQELAGYRLERLLGSGEVGVTYLARNKKGSAVVLKAIDKKLSDFSAIEGLWQKQQILKRTRATGLVAPVDSTWSDCGRFVLTREAIDAVSLEQALSAPLSPGQIAKIAKEASDALVAAHAADVIHGSLKPQNVLLERSVAPERGFVVRLVDFSSYLLLDDDLPPSPYRAPEQSKKTIRSSDFFALGRLLVEAIVGHADATLDDLPKAVRQAFEGLLHQDPNERVTDFAELHQALAAWAKAEPTRPDADVFATPKNVGPRGVASIVDEEAKDQEPDTVPQQTENNEKNPAQTTADAAAPEDAELAAMAELAAAPLREARRKRTGSQKPAKSKDVEASRETVKTTPDDGARNGNGNGRGIVHEDTVTLPIERSVKAYVSGISPSLDETMSGDDSLESALNSFVVQAKTVSRTLPEPLVDDRRLAQLAQAPVDVDTVGATPIAAPSPGPQSAATSKMVIAAVVGAVVAVLAIKLIDRKAAPNNTTPQVTKQVTTPKSTPLGKPETGKPEMAKGPNTSGGNTASATTTTNVANSDKTRTPLASESTGKTGSTTVNATAGTSDATDTTSTTSTNGATTGTTAAKSPTTATDSTTSASSASTSGAGRRVEPAPTTAAAKTPAVQATKKASAARVTAAPKTVVAKTAPKKKARPKKATKARRRTLASRRTSRKKHARKRRTTRRTKTQAASKKGKKGDWVDPFSQ